MSSPQLLDPALGGTATAAEMLRRGKLVAFPTETVYGLGADATDDLAVARIFQAKERPTFNPLIVHVPDLAAAQAIAEFPPDADDLARAFWPGPLTLVLPLRPTAGIAPLVTAGHDTIAIRVPGLPLARELLSRAAIPVAAPSANPSGRVSPTLAAHVVEGLGDRTDAVLDGGPCQVGLESTIIGGWDAPILLRPGGLPAEAVEACLGVLLDQPAAGKRPAAPGQLASHYAPSGQIRLDVTEPRPEEVLLGFGHVDAALNLSPSGDLTEAAARLFHHLHQLDRQGARHIAVSPIPETGIGRAINDRLRRAAAPR